MPRPLVEVRQTVLNPTVTINDPQQEVCIIGLHTDDFTNKTVNTLNRHSDLGTGDPRISAAVDHEFVIETNGGIFLDSEMDFGPDAYDLSGNQELAFVSARVDYGDPGNATNLTYTGAGTLNSFTPNEFTLSPGLADLHDNFNALKANNLDLTFIANPTSTFTNKLVQDGSSSIDFITHPDFKDATEVHFGSFSFGIIRKDSDALYLRGETTADNVQLNANNASNSSRQLLASSGGDAIVGVEDETFSLEHPGAHEANVVSVSANNTVLLLDSPLPFGIHVATEIKTALIEELSSTALSSLTVKETDAAQPLAIEVQSDGDAEVTVESERLVDASGRAIVRATFSMSYTVAKTNLSDKLYSIDANTREATLGVSSPRNQLSLATELALANSGSSSVKVLALDISPLEGETENRSLADAYANALAILNRNSTVYAMVPLTTDINTLKTYANAADSLSQPTKGKFRICLGSSNGAPSADYILGSPTSQLTGGNVAANNVLTNAIGTQYKLPASKVLVNDIIIATDTVNSVKKTYSGKVSAVTQSSLTITWDTGLAPVGAVDLDGYYISRSLTSLASKPRQIEILAAEASAVATKRLFLTFPGTCTVASGGNSYAGLPSYYVTSAFAGLLARLEIHRPKNFLGLVGISNLQDFSRFSDDELDQISDAGYLVFQQEETTSAPFCVHQVNTYHGTQAGTQEFTELSVLANFDFVSRYFKEILDPFVGTVNIVPSTLSTVRASLESGIDNLTSRRVANIGAPIISGSVQHVRKASFDQGTVEANILVSLPKVLNKIILEVVSG